MPWLFDVPLHLVLLQSIQMQLATGSYTVMRLFPRCVVAIATPANEAPPRLWDPMQGLASDPGKPLNQCSVVA